MEETNAILPIGYTFHYERYKYHVVAWFKDPNGNDPDEILYVVKYFGKHKQWWHYEVMEDWAYRDRLESGLIKK